MADVVVGGEKFEINGLKLLRMQGCTALVDEAVRKTAARANAAGHGAYDGDTRKSKIGTPHGLVHTADKHACYGERKHNTLLKALGG